MDQDELQTAHRHFAIDAFNRCWELIDKADRDAADDREMLRRAEVSFWHWMQVDARTAENEGIGLWLLARVHTLASSPATALVHGETYLALAKGKELGAFHEGYAHEAIARAQFAGGAQEKAAAALDTARACLERIEDQESRELLEADLKALEGAG